MHQPGSSDAAPPAGGARADANLLLLVDGHAYAYRAFHAIRNLAAPSGAPTNAIFGFIKALEKLRGLCRPSHVAVVWDGGLARERLDLLPAYKAQRPPMPASLAVQIADLQEWLAALGLASHQQAGVEADDWIATLARRAVAAGARVVIASSDKDFMQLAGPAIGLLNPNDKSEAVWTAEQVRARAGVEPEQIVDWLSLVGDSVDNIPGVPGVGAKTAAELLRRFGTLEGLLARLPEVASVRIRKALAQAGPLLERNRDMIRLKADLPGDFDLADLAPREPSAERLRPLYERWGFRSMLRALQPEPAVQGQLF